MEYALSSITEDNMAVHNLTQAKHNDRIILENLEVAKALNRHNGNGATMHKFSLWSKQVSPLPPTPPPMSTTSTSMSTMTECITSSSTLSEMIASASGTQNDRRDSSLASISEDTHIAEDNNNNNNNDFIIILKTPTRTRTDSYNDIWESSPRTTATTSICTTTCTTTTEQSTPSSAYSETPRKCASNDSVCHVGVMRAVNLSDRECNRSHVASAEVMASLRPSARDEEYCGDERNSNFASLLYPAVDDSADVSDNVAYRLQEATATSPDSAIAEKIDSAASTPARLVKTLRILKKGASPGHSNHKSAIPKSHSRKQHTTPQRVQATATTTAAPTTPRSAFGRSASSTSSSFSSKQKLPPIESTSTASPAAHTPGKEFLRISREPGTASNSNYNVLRRTPPSPLKLPPKISSVNSRDKIAHNGIKIPPLTASLTLRPSSVYDTLTSTAGDTSVPGDNSARKGTRDRTAQSRLGSTRRSGHSLFTPIVKRSPFQGNNSTKLFASNHNNNNNSDTDISAGEESVLLVSPTRRLEKVFRRKSASPLPMLAARAAKIHFGEPEIVENKQASSSSSGKNKSKVSSARRLHKAVEVSPVTKVVAGMAENVSMKQSLSDSAKLKLGTEEACTIRWKRGQLIGEGTFGKVYKGLNEHTGELLAVKQLYLADTDESDVEGIQEEINVICNLNHPNIVNYLGTTTTDRHLFILLEYVPGGSIAGMLSQFGAFSEDLIRRFSHQILLGLEYLHNKLIVHRDIKGSNILVTDGGVAKLSDFGCSKQLAGMRTMSIEGSAKVLKGSVPWMAPEVIKQCGYGRSSDIWSFGATVIEMGMYLHSIRIIHKLNTVFSYYYYDFCFCFCFVATGQQPWPEFSNNLATLFHIAKSETAPAVPDTLSPVSTLFISRCMGIDPKSRHTAAELLRDEFLAPEYSNCTGKGGLPVSPSKRNPGFNS